MLISDISWVREYGKKLCPSLRNHIYDFYRPLKWYPCYLKPVLVNWRTKFKYVNVIIEHEPECCSADLVLISSTVQKHRCKVLNHLPLINGFAGQVNLRALAELAAIPGIRKIWHDREVRAVLNTAAPVLKAPESWDWGFTGEGITVAVIDTGIHPHADLTKPSNRLIAFQDFFPDTQHLQLRHYHI